jgi:hypothetical protein
MSFFSVHSAEKVQGLATALGDMLLAWTEAEDAQIHAMAAMLSIHINDALRVYQKLPNFRSRTQMLYLLIELHPPYEAISAEVGGLSKLSKTRNRYVHGGFIQSISEPTDIRSIDYSERSGSPNRSKPTKPADITNHANAVRKRAKALMRILEALPVYKAWLGLPLQAGD